MGNINSEFGKGFAYCIGLFLAHAERKDYLNEYHLWFNGAADHLLELEIPNIFPSEIKEEIKKWQDKCIYFRCMGKPEKIDKNEAIEKAKYFLLEYDKLNGIDAIKGDCV